MGSNFDLREALRRVRSQQQGSVNLRVSLSFSQSQQLAELQPAVVQPSLSQPSSQTVRRMRESRLAAIEHNPNEESVQPYQQNLPSSRYPTQAARERSRSSPRNSQVLSQSSTERSRRLRAQRSQEQPPSPRNSQVLSQSSTERSRNRRAHLSQQQAPSPRNNQALSQSSGDRVRRMRAQLSQEQAPPNENQVAGRDGPFEQRWRAATDEFNRRFVNDPFGQSCSICDRLWFRSNLKRIRESHIVHVEPILRERGITESQARVFMACSNCYQTLQRGRLPRISTSNGFKYPPKPTHLPPLNPISIRLVSPRIPFMSLRRLRRYGQYALCGQVINVPISVDQVINLLPRNLDDDQVINVALKRRLIHNSAYLSGEVRKRDLRTWLDYLQATPLYRQYNIRIDWPAYERSEARLHNEIRIEEARQRDAGVINPNEPIIEPLEADARDIDILIANQRTMLWSEEHTLNIAPGQNRAPLNIYYDLHAEELSFPQIYYGHGRNYPPHVQVTPFLISNSEIRRTDRRGVTPDHVLYMAMKILRLRVVEGVFGTFRNIAETENVTRAQIEDRNWLENQVVHNYAFLKSIPNSAHYWSSRKSELFAMLRQLGKPSIFLTMSASEVRWPSLLSLLLRLNPDKVTARHVDDLTSNMRSELVNEDPVTCCIYFDKLVEVVMSLLISKRNYNPFGRYRVIDFFKRIEFQQRGSPHAHILLWLENDPKEALSEDMPQTLQMIKDLCSVSRADLDESLYRNQVHEHTTTCYKRGEKYCRFNIPYFPMKESKVLLPMSDQNPRKRSLVERGRRVRDNLETKNYQTIDEFFQDNNLNDELYLDIIRAFINRPTPMFKRDMDEKKTNQFNPWIASVLKSNMDIQYILDEYSCAAYVADYVNKANRGISNLHREIIKLTEAFPELVHSRILSKLGEKVLNTVELSAQEASWWLLRQPFSQASRYVEYIPTDPPRERTKSYKRRQQLDEEGIEQDSTDVWTKNCIQKYEERPVEMNDVCLADFVSRFTKCTKSSANRIAGRYYQKTPPSVIRWHNYNESDPDNYKRELVTLFLPFRNEVCDILDRDKYLTIYNENTASITRKLSEYSLGIDYEQLVAELNRMRAESHEYDVNMERAEFIRGVIMDGEEENFDDLHQVNRNNPLMANITRRNNVLSSEDYCKLMRTTNPRQREFILEFVHRIHLPEREPIRVFFGGPAGCGKSYVLRAIMDTYNRYCRLRDNTKNAYLACATTGKASVNIDAVTVYSALSINSKRAPAAISFESLHNLRHTYCELRCVIIDEVSMMGASILKAVHTRCTQISLDPEMAVQPFGKLDIIFCGDFRQLPPVRQAEVFKGSRDHMEGPQLWHSLDYFPLNQVMRQSDIVFSSILTKIGDGTQLDPHEIQTIEGRFRTQEWCDANLQGVIRLYHTNEEVTSYNRSVLPNPTELRCHDVLSNYSSDQQRVNAQRALNRLSYMETGGLPYSVLTSIGYTYMVTSNIDVADGLVNGSFGIIRYRDEVFGDRNDGIPKHRVWLEFQPPRVGQATRLKNQALYRTGDGRIDPTWTPIVSRTATIALPQNVKCKRTQLPLVPALAVTIHKSQGGTFDRAVIKYRSSLAQSLVYTAFSRVSSLDGLFLVNTENDFRFYHGKANDDPKMRAIRDEYRRLGNHQLRTLYKDVISFCRHSEEGYHFEKLCTINAQSLVAHHEDISSDDALTKAHILVITETWMRENTPCNIEGYQLVNQSNKSRIAGGVAIYRKIDHPLEARMIGSSSAISGTYGDYCWAEFRLGGIHRFTVGAIYIHPNVPMREIKPFLDNAMNACRTSSQQSWSNRSILVTGDFNKDISKEENKWLQEFMETRYHLRYISHTIATTRENTTIDLTFVRNLDVCSMPYISYFSYHRPLFSRIKFERPS